MALWETLETVLVVPVLVIVALSILARKRPDVRWLQVFNLQSRLTEEQRARLRRTQNRRAGAELIMLGIVIPLGFLGLKMMLFFSSISAVELVVVGLLSATCIVGGVVALVRNT